MTADLNRLQMCCATGVANSEMTFGDEIQDPKPKRQRKADKAIEAGSAGIADPAAGEAAASEPAELTRTGAAEVVADADSSVPATKGESACH